MVESLVVFFPAMIAVVVYRIFNKEICVKKLSAYILFYVISTNFLVLLGLYLIGMGKFNLFEMSLRFKIKWLALEFVFSCIFTWIYANARYIHRHELSVRKHCKMLFPAALFLIVTYVVYTPSSLFLANINEFSISYRKVVPLLAAMAFIFMAGIYVVSLCFLNEKNVIYYIALLFSIATGAYVQGNFLNPSFATLDGAEINWASYHKEVWISGCFWVLCFVVIFMLAFWQKEKLEKGIKYIAYFVSAVQMVSLAVLVVMNPLDGNVDRGFTKEDEFTVGSEENIILFVVDTLQTAALDEYLASEAYEEGRLDDFTFFENAVAGGAPTRAAMPLLLTGVEYDPAQTLDEYREEAWSETTLYDDLHENGYDVRFYSGLQYIAGFSDETVENYGVTGEHWIGDYIKFSRKLYTLVNFNLMPQILKEYFWLSTDELTEEIEASDVGYMFDDVRFYQDMQASGPLQVNYGKTFRLYHLTGVHAPYTMTENVEYAGENIQTSEQQVLQGIMKIIYRYLDEIKAAGVYEESTIIIMGDHGRHGEGNPETNPAVLIKLPGETHTLARNSAPVHFRNVVATMAGTAIEDYSAYGPSVYDITAESDVERLHTVDTNIRNRIVINEDYNESLPYTRLIISGESGNCEYHVWDPYQINCIPYRIGDIIDFQENSEYVRALDYRLYKENGTAIASNELSICFELTDYSKEDIELHFICSDLYNDSQKIRVYTGEGTKAGNVICTKEDIGEEKTLTISPDDIRDGKLVVRMVFPNAVTPNQLDRSNSDTRVLSVAFDSIWLEQTAASQ